MTRRRRIAIVLILGCIAAVIAFPMRGLVFTYIMSPLSFIWFYVVYFYHVIPQQIYWIFILLAAAYITIGGLLENPLKRKSPPEIRKQTRGPVGSLAFWIKDSKKGVYSRWRVAHSLGVMADKILGLRGNRLERFKPLRGKDWNPPPEVQEYLEAGLNRSFADYPLTKRPSPFDMDVAKVVDYLESQLEMNRDNK